MQPLPSNLRSKLERAVVDAREAAEEGARAALEALAAHHHEPYPHMKPAERELRNHLRARARQLGDKKLSKTDAKGNDHEINHLMGECAYEHWHRMLFARFLAENNLLIEPEEKVAITLEEAEELAKDRGSDVWAFASRCAQGMLPQIFRPDDPLLQVSFATEHRIRLEKLLSSLPQAMFTASDALGWVYQFWQSRKKDEVNKSGVKIGADEISAVTQLFTEPYMVSFLLHNTLGAWWAGKTLTAEDAENSATEEALRKKLALPGVSWDYLRFVKAARPSRVAKPSRSGFGVAKPSRSGSRSGSGSSFGLNETLRISAGENLPHWTCDNATYHVSFRLADSVPQTILDEWVREREAIMENAKNAKREPTASEEDRMRFLYSDRIDKFLDAGYGACYMAAPEIAQLIADALQHFDGDRYELHAWCVMPNHVHAVVKPLAEHNLSAIIHSWKSFTAHEANKALGRSGDFWQHDAYNHIIRSEKEYVFQTRYVWENPDKAGLKDWKWRGIISGLDWDGLYASVGHVEPDRDGLYASVGHVDPDRDGLNASVGHGEPDRDGLDASVGHVDPDRDGLVTWLPAAGMFEGWPKNAKDIKVLDPCCGSGHFLVAALHHLVPIRMAEEGLSAIEAVDAIIRDNLHGLEIDERCCQIAAFALAFAAWTYPDAGGYRPLPELNIACTGIGPHCSADQWIKLAEQSGMPKKEDLRERIKNGLLNLHRLFSQASTLGSLINPHELIGDLLAADYKTIQPYLVAVLKAEKADDETRERAIAAAGMVKAADLLTGEYTLVITNPPYLGRGLQGTIIREFGDRFAPEAKNNLATLFLVRVEGVLVTGGTLAFVTPQDWLFLPRFRTCRKRAFSQFLWHFAVRLGENAFESPQAAGAFAALVCYSMGRPTSKHRLAGIDAAANRNEPPILPPDKAHILQGRVMAAEAGRRKCSMLPQSSQLTNPDSRLVLTELEESPLLSEVAFSRTGTRTADNQSLLPSFWEAAEQETTWRLVQSTVCNTVEWGGCEHALRWDEGQGRLHELNSLGLASIQGEDAWGRPGIVVSLTGTLSVTLYTGVPFDMNAGVVCPKRASDLPALWAYMSSPRYHDDVRAIDQQLKLTTATLLKVPFDLDEWTATAADKYPNGLPEPESDDPTQWLFHGWPNVARASRSGLPNPNSGSSNPDKDSPVTPGRDGPCSGSSGSSKPDRDGLVTLQVAVARLMGYRWPAELDDKMRLSKRARDLVKRCEELIKLADDDGIVCIPSVRGEDPAADRLLKLLAACDIEPEVDLDGWLRNTFFVEHCKLFHDRPFVWQIWDGRKRDGFHALVNYHKLAEGNGKGRRLLESLTYAYLGEWITRQKDGVKRGEGGAEDRLAAAVELQNRLKAILEGEPPFDIFVRWKPLSEQAISWEPDINDGVRLNIRPFLASDLPKGPKGAGVLRTRPKSIKWGKDRGKEPERPKEDYPWFWGWDERTVDFTGGKEFDGYRWNDCHFTNKARQAARGTRKDSL